MNKRIGWPDDILTARLGEVEKAASDLADYHISAGDFRNEDGTWIRRAQREDFEDAVRLAELLESCITVLDKAGAGARFYQIVQAYYLGISAVYHNYRVYDLPGGEDSRKLSKKEFRFREMAAVFNTLLLLTDPAEEKDYDSFRRKTFDGWWDVIEPNAWLRTAAYVLHSDSRRIESFWKLIEKHSFFGNRYAYLLSLAAQTPEGDEVIESIGSYIADHLDEERISNFLVRNDLFEATALEYAYRHNLTEIAHKIIYNQYFGYLELPMLLIIRRYDRKEYEHIFPTLAMGCLKRLRKDLRSVSGMNLPGVDDLAKYLIKDMDEKEQNAVGTLRDRKLLEHCDSLYVVSERQTEAFAPLIIFAQKGSYIQFAD